MNDQIDNLLSEISKFKTNIVNSNNLLELLRTVMNKLETQEVAFEDSHKRIFDKIKESNETISEQVIQSNQRLTETISELIIQSNQRLSEKMELLITCKVNELINLTKRVFWVSVGITLFILIILILLVITLL